MGRGILFSVLAGLMIALQNIFVARLNSKLDLMHTNTFVQGTGFLIAAVLLVMSRKVNFTNIGQVNKVYLLAGLLGAIIIFSVARGISAIGASYAVTILIVSEILFTFVISLFGFFGETVLAISFTKILGLVLMIGGVILFQFGK